MNIANYKQKVDNILEKEIDVSFHESEKWINMDIWKRSGSFEIRKEDGFFFIVPAIMKFAYKDINWMRSNVNGVTTIDRYKKYLKDIGLSNFKFIDRFFEWAEDRYVDNNHLVADVKLIISEKITDDFSIFDPRAPFMNLLSTGEIRKVTFIENGETSWISIIHVCEDAITVIDNYGYEFNAENDKVLQSFGSTEKATTFMLARLFNSKISSDHVCLNDSIRSWWQLTNNGTVVEVEREGGRFYACYGCGKVFVLTAEELSSTNRLKRCVQCR